MALAQGKKARLASEPHIKAMNKLVQCRTLLQMLLCRRRRAVLGTPSTTRTILQFVPNTSVHISRHPLQHLRKKWRESVLHLFYLDGHLTTGHECRQAF